MNPAVIYIVPCDVRIEMMGFCLFFEFSLQLNQFFWILFGQIDSFRVVVVQVVEFSGAFVECLAALGVPCNKAVRVSQFSFPAVIIDRSRAEDVVVLQPMTPGRTILTRSLKRH